MEGHSVFPMGKEKTTKEFQELIKKFLSTPKPVLKYVQGLTKEQVKSMAILTTLIQCERNRIRYKLNEIRSQMNIPRSNIIMQTKQQLTNLIKELK